MKPFLLVVLMLAPVSALADSITFTVTNAIVGLDPNNGSGDNVGFILSGNGFTFSGAGGTDFFYFNDQGYARPAQRCWATPLCSLKAAAASQLSGVSNMGQTSCCTTLRLCS
jgi:hypothetical protein